MKRYNRCDYDVPIVGHEDSEQFPDELHRSDVRDIKVYSIVEIAQGKGGQEKKVKAKRKKGKK